jgi:ABC-type phosphate/phosphonate transport system substrate-binding protein
MIQPTMMAIRKTTAILAMLTLAGVFVMPHALGDNGELVLGVSPLLDEQDTRRQFQPLCDYLGAVSQRPCRIVTRPNYLTYWESMRRGQTYNLLLDDAHFTDYRIQKMGYTVLAKIPHTVTYSLAIPRSAKIHDPARLVGRRIATLGIPSMGAAFLNGLFPQPSKQPIPVEVDNAAEGFALLRSGKVEAAILPTPLVREEILRGAELRVLLSTAPIPQMGISVAPDIDPDTRKLLQKALLQAHKSPAGQKLLAELGIERFDAATATIYKGQARILQQYWGY